MDASPRDSPVPCDVLMPLEQLRPGEWADVAEVSGEASWVCRMAELGVRAGCRICLLQPGSPTQSSPPDCFVLKIGTRVHGDAGEGTVVGTRCSPANQLTQYWVRKPNGERFWATAQELKPM